MSDEPEPYFSKDLHDHGVLALARVTWERDDAQIALKASKLVAEVAEEGMVRWKREAEAAKAEIARLRTAFEKYLTVTRPLLGDTKAWSEASGALQGRDPKEDHDQ